MFFDTNTVIVTAGALGVVMGCVQWLAWLHVRSETSLAIWSAANIACAIGLGIMALPFVPKIPMSPLANFWFLLGTGLTYIGMRSFDRAPNPPRLLVLTVAMAAFAAFLTLVFIDSPTARLSVFSIATVAWLGAAAWRLARVPPTSQAFSRMAVALFLSIFCAMHLARLLAVATGIPPFLRAPATEQLAVTLLISLVCGVGLNYGAMFMVLDRLASADELTGLCNRRALLRRGQALLDRMLIQGRPLSVLLVDLDHFKQVNDRFGHAGGDEAIRRFADTLRTQGRSGDPKARLGGEEFATIMTGVSLKEARGFAERVLTAFAALEVLTEDGRRFRCTASAGIAFGAADGASVEQVMLRADNALYSAKRAGRNRVESSDLRLVG